MAADSDSGSGSASSTTTPPCPLSLLDRVAIVTGASRGIGKAISLHLASMGARIIINYTSISSQSNAETLAAQINSPPISLSSSFSSSSAPRAAVFRADVSDPTHVKSLFDFAEQTFKTQPHVLVTSAGVSLPHYPAISETHVSDFDRVFSVNARGTFLCMKEAAGRITRGGGGRIVAVSSSLTGVFRPGTAAYTASKAAVEAMTKIIAKAMKGTGITVNAVAPGPIATEMYLEGKSEERIQKAIDECPLGRLGKVEDVAPLVGFLVSDGGKWVNGQIIKVNGGYV